MAKEKDDSKITPEMRVYQAMEEARTQADFWSGGAPTRLTIPATTEVEITNSKKVF